jgi:hypothetical protein
MEWSYGSTICDLGIRWIWVLKAQQRDFIDPSQTLKNLFLFCIMLFLFHLIKFNLFDYSTIESLYRKWEFFSDLIIFQQ